MVATMPQFLAFEDGTEKAFFRMQSVVIAGVTVLTNFEAQGLAGEREASIA